jgi:hypothetical protein
MPFATSRKSYDSKPQEEPYMSRRVVDAAGEHPFSANVSSVARETAESSFAVQADADWQAKVDSGIQFRVGDAVARRALAVAAGSVS